MKNLIAFITLTTLVFFTSCSKEALLEPTTDSEITYETVAESYIQTQESPNPSPVAAGKSTVVPVTTITSSVAGNLLTVDFSSSHDFSSSILQATQTLDFVDGSGNTTTLTFQVNTFTGSNGSLEVNYAIGGNELGGLVIKEAQIVIDDQIIN